MLLPIFCPAPNQTTTGSVAAMLAADPVDFKEMAAEQNRCPETQRLLGGTSLKLAFRQTGAQRLAGDDTTGNFRPIFPSNSGKAFLIIFTILLILGGLPPIVLFHLGLCGAVFTTMSPAGPAGCLACQRGKIHRHTCLVPQPIPIPLQRFSHLYVDLVGPLQYGNN